MKIRKDTGNAYSREIDSYRTHPQDPGPFES